MKEQIKDIRLDIDALAQYTNNINNDVNYSDYIQATSRSLFFAKAWLGKLLGEFPDNPSPYKEGKQIVADIEPTSDREDVEQDIHCFKSFKALIQTEVFLKASRVSKISSMRTLIGTAVDVVRTLTDLPSSREAAICRTQAWVYLCEARFHLGFELESIREDAIANKKEDDQAV